METDRGRDFYDSIFQNFLSNKSIKQYSRKSSLGAVFAKTFNRTIRDGLKKVVFGGVEANWKDVSNTITKQYFKRIHSSIKVTLNQASLKKDEGYVYQNLMDKRKKIDPILEFQDVVTTADFKENFLERRYNELVS